MTCGLRKDVIMRKQTRHRFVATNYNHYKCLLPFLLYNSYCTKFAQQRKGKLAKTKIFLSLTSGVCFFVLIFENYHTIPLAQNEIHLQLQLKSPIQDDGALVLYIRATINLVHKGLVFMNKVAILARPSVKYDIIMLERIVGGEKQAIQLFPGV